MESSNELCIVTGYDHIQLGDEIVKLSDRLNKISINELSFLKNLEEWRHESHELIDKYCQLKSNEYQRRTKEEINRLKETMNILSNDHDAADDYLNWVKETIQLIHQQLDELQQIQSKFSPLQIDHSMIYFPPEMSDLKRQLTPLKDLFPSSTFSFESSKQTMKCSSDYWYSLSTNETHLLILGKSHLYLIDHSLTIVNQKSFTHVGIKDICWSNILSRFLLISPKEIFILNDKNLSFEICSISQIDNNPWERGTTSEINFFLSTFGENPFIIQYYLLPSIHLNKRYQSSIICQETEIINDLKSNEHSLGIIIENGFNNQTRLELRLIKSFQCIYSIDLGRGWGYRCSPLTNNDRWIITDSYNQRLIYISQNGIIDQIDNYSTKPFNVIYWNEDQFIIRTIDGIDIHQCK
jgi:hypothetical protein